MENEVKKMELAEYISYLFKTVRLAYDESIQSPIVKDQRETSCPESKWQEGAFLPSN